MKTLTYLLLIKGVLSWFRIEICSIPLAWSGRMSTSLYSAFSNILEFHLVWWSTFEQWEYLYTQEVETLIFLSHIDRIDSQNAKTRKIKHYEDTLWHFLKEASTQCQKSLNSSYLWSFQFFKRKHHCTNFFCQ